ncbi:SemiSWEET transporter [Cyanobacterium aponinum AL20118]|uniref:Cystinosin/ERS1p repeat protein n=2 Tax=Cyanobacterium aponinum TaxID=379064 RepID=K9ZAS3_CYAAP|nr:SemiSWEET transporter [Cyanobacterium aponinum]AFZ55493.1 Cystinosin/ERS1p repeat protein [Cyanobacterium aponinum PCC 10605]MBD2392798.1 SemiSWEET transporter [Cyanobacterium aponinum FACHB-4101]WPF88673.1 SemiSWEET transporter [Cyanobacterium aponinum AL20115]
MEWITIIGLMAGSLTTISFLPQAIKTWRSKSAKDISLAMFLCFCLGVVLWIIYGLFIMDIPVLVTNIVTLILAGTILFFKLKYK